MIKDNNIKEFRIDKDIYEYKDYNYINSIKR